MSVKLRIPRTSITQKTFSNTPFF